jgi:hypothetical protein
MERTPPEELLPADEPDEPDKPGEPGEPDGQGHTGSLH